MSTQLDIYNMALAHCGITYAVGSLTEESKERRVCEQFYTICRDRLLQEFPWPFAMKAVALAVITDTSVPGWTYSYGYPADCLFAYRVCPVDGVRAAIEEITDVRQTVRTAIPVYPFDVVYSETQTGIVTDVEEAYLIYTARVEETARFSPLFVTALAYALAGDIALPLTVEPQAKQNIMQMAEYTKGIAQSRSFNESVPDSAPTPQAILARG